jgi:signal transduction histidine kinase
MLFLEQLELEQQLSSRGKDVLEHAQLATTSLSSLLEGLLDISRLDGHAIKPRIRSFAIQDLLDRLEEDFRPLAEQKGIRLKFSPCSSVIASDNILTGQILRNLISNAIRYTQSGRVLVGCRHRNGMLSIEVHDTGVGIAEDQFHKIFDEFYQVENRNEIGSGDWGWVCPLSIGQPGCSDTLSRCRPVWAEDPHLP